MNWTRAGRLDHDGNTVNEKAAGIIAGLALRHQENSKAER
jgi:hypothetical protein